MNLPPKIVTIIQVPHARYHTHHLANHSAKVRYHQVLTVLNKQTIRPPRTIEKTNGSENNKGYYLSWNLLLSQGFFGSDINYDFWSFSF